MNDMVLSGENNIAFAKNNMPVVDLVAVRLKLSGKLKGKRVIICSHVTKETAVAAIAMKEAGADVLLVASNPISTQDDVAEALRQNYGMEVLGFAGESNEEFLEFKRQSLNFKPDLFIDDSAKLLPLIYDERPDLIDGLLGSIEQTTQGVSRAKVMDNNGMLKKPVIGTNSSVIKLMFENKYGVGQTALYSLFSLSGELIAGMTVVVVGYGTVGQGCAIRCAGAGAHVIVCETDPVKALQAHYDGYAVMNMEEAARVGEAFFTATGTVNAIPYKYIEMMRPGARLINVGSGQNEIQISELKSHAIKVEERNDYETTYYLPDGRFVIMATDGRTANHVVVGGDPPTAMDLTFAALLLSAEYLIDNHEHLEPHVLTLPYEVDCSIAYLKLNELRLNICQKTEEQIEYDKGWHSR